MTFLYTPVSIVQPSDRSLSRNSLWAERGRLTLDTFSMLEMFLCSEVGRPEETLQASGHKSLIRNLCFPRLRVLLQLYLAVSRLFVFLLEGGEGSESPSSACTWGWTVGFRERGWEEPAAAGCSLSLCFSVSSVHPSLGLHTSDGS